MRKQHIIWAFAAGAIGLLLVGYYGLWVFQTSLSGVSPVGYEDAPPGMITGIGIFVVAMGVLSIIAALGYARNARWGWYFHLAAAVGMLAFPGTLFEFKPDLHHLIAWVSALLTLILVIWVEIARRKPQRP
jgi:hypothetical protein